MPDRGVENQGVVVIHDCLFYCLIDRATHSGIILTIAELTDNQTTQVLQNPTHAQVIHHPVYMVMPLCDVFNQKDGGSHSPAIL